MKKNIKLSIVTVLVSLVASLFVGVSSARADSDDYVRVGAGLPYNGSYTLTNYWNCSKRDIVGKFAGFGGTGNNVNQLGTIVNTPVESVGVLTPGQSTEYRGLSLNFAPDGQGLSISVLSPNPATDNNMTGLNIWIQCNKKDDYDAKTKTTSPHYYRTTITDLLISKDPGYKAPAPVYEPNAISVQINFDSTTNGGSAVTPSSRVVEVGDAVLFPIPTERNGYDFLGWYSSPSGGVKVSAPYAVTFTHTLYARWQAQSRTVNFDSNGGGSNPASVTCVSGTPSPALPGAPTRDGYSFLGWFTSATGGTKVSDACTGPSTLFAQWAKVISFNSNGGGSNPASVTCVSGTPSPALPGAPTRDGYSFLGWFTSATGGTKVSDACTGPSTLFAQWEPVVVPAVIPNTLGAVVYFGFDIRTLDATARATIDALVAQLPSNKKNIQIQLVGWAQIGKSSKYDLTLSRDRAKVVRDYLRSLGVTATYSISGKGWDGDDAKSRRTEIFVTLN